MSGDYMGDEYEPKGELMPYISVATIIERLEAQGDVNLPDDIVTATELACTLRQIADVFGGDVNRYLFGKEASIAMAYGAGPTVVGAMTSTEPATLTVGGEKPRVTVGGRDFEEGWEFMKDGIAEELARFSQLGGAKRPAGVKVSRDLANAIGEKLGAPIEMDPGSTAALHFEGITVIVSEKIHGFGWEWIW